MIDIENVVSRVSVGRIVPSMQITVMNEYALDDKRKALCIVMHVYNACTEPDDDTKMPLFQSYPVPEFETEAAAVNWIYECVEAVLVHELHEFFRFDGKQIKAPKHPLDTP